METVDTEGIEGRVGALVAGGVVVGSPGSAVVDEADGLPVEIVVAGGELAVVVSPSEVDVGELVVVVSPSEVGEVPGSVGGAVDVDSGNEVSVGSPLEGALVSSIEGTGRSGGGASVGAGAGGAGAGGAKAGPNWIGGGGSGRSGMYAPTAATRANDTTMVERRTGPDPVMPRCPARSRRGSAERSGPRAGTPGRCGPGAPD